MPPSEEKVKKNNRQRAFPTRIKVLATKTA